MTMLIRERRSERSINASNNCCRQFKLVLSVLLQLFVLSTRGVTSHANLPDNFPLYAIMLIQSHNAAQSKAYGWLYAQQELDLRGQWQSGARAFKVPLHWYSPDNALTGRIAQPFKAIKNMVAAGSQNTDSQPYIALCHEGSGNNNCQLTTWLRLGKNPQPAVDFLMQLNTLLQENSQEIAVLKIESYLTRNSDKNGTSDYSPQIIATELDKVLQMSGLKNYAYKLSANANITLGDLRKSNKRLLIFIDDKAILALLTYLNDFNTFVNQTHWEADKFDRCAMVKNRTSAPLTEIHLNPESSLPRNSVKGKAISTIKTLGILSSNKTIVATDYDKLHSQSNINQRLENCETANNIVANFISSDYINRGDLQSYVTDKNQQRTQALK